MVVNFPAALQHYCAMDHDLGGAVAGRERRLAVHYEIKNDDSGSVPKT
jgi:hypothetical protein